MPYRVYFFALTFTHAYRYMCLCARLPLSNCISLRKSFDCQLTAVNPLSECIFPSNFLLFTFYHLISIFILFIYIYTYFFSFGFALHSLAVWLPHIVSTSISLCNLWIFGGFIPWGLREKNYLQLSILSLLLLSKLMR